MLPKWMSLRFGLLISFFFFLIGLTTLPNYGVDWDTINHALRGQAYLHYFLTHETTYQKLPESKDYYQKENTLLFSSDQKNIPRRSFYQHTGYDAQYFLNKDGGHPPLSDILSSIFNYIFFQKLGLINDVDSYHLYPLLLGSILVGTLFFFVSKYYGKFAATVTILSLALYPLFQGELHFNSKDIPETVFFSLTLIFFHEGIVNKSIKNILFSAIAFGFAFGTKFNILFSVFIMFFWIVLYLLLVTKKKSKSFKLLIPVLFVYPLIPTAILFATWPYLWSSPVKRFFEVVWYYRTIGTNFNFNPDYLFFLFNTYAAQWILFTTPLVVLAFFSFGVLYFIFKGRFEKNFTCFLVLLWFLVPIVRVSLPNAGIYGGVRQIMEYIPAMAILSGIGAKYIVELLYCYVLRRHSKHKKQSSNLATKQLVFLKLGLILLFLPITLKLISIHPNENVYFNPLIGGLKGAREKNIPFWGNSFGNAYRQGVVWVNKNAEKNSTLVLSQDLMPNLPKIFVREDLLFDSAKRSGFLKKGEYVIGLNYGSDSSRSYYSSRYYFKNLQPIYQITVDSIPILFVWKNDVAHTKMNYIKEQKLVNPVFQTLENGILIDLKSAQIVSKIEINFQENVNCKKADQVFFEISINGEDWLRTPHVLPSEFVIPLLQDQIHKGTLMYPFAADETRYIFVNISPKDSCLKNVQTITVYHLPDVSVTKY